MTDAQRAMVEAVRNDPKVGRGTCSIFAEAYDDGELVEYFERNGLETPEAAVTACREHDALYWEHCDDIAREAF
jgi:hypothetical protein